MSKIHGKKEEGKRLQKNVLLPIDRTVGKMVKLDPKGEIKTVSQVLRKHSNKGQYKTLILCCYCGHYHIDRRKVVEFPQYCQYCTKKIYYTHKSVAWECDLLPDTFKDKQASRGVYYRVSRFKND